MSELNIKNFALIDDSNIVKNIIRADQAFIDKFMKGKWKYCIDVTDKTAKIRDFYDSATKTFSIPS